MHPIIEVRTKELPFLSRLLALSHDAGYALKSTHSFHYSLVLDRRFLVSISLGRKAVSHKHIVKCHKVRRMSHQETNSLHDQIAQCFVCLLPTTGTVFGVTDALAYHVWHQVKATGK